MKKQFRQANRTDMRRVTDPLAVMVIRFHEEEEEEPTLTMVNREAVRIIQPLLREDYEGDHVDQFWSSATTATETLSPQRQLFISLGSIIQAEFQRMVFENQLYVVVTAKRLRQIERIFK
ncbi:hypothetical protein PROFUN_05409 [Planoprotostelium fungivorum]|uniref:Uncharacterized protein n=1 Tax=Planoprotostelium fungivorum TaxID=1890364 RepID=A0A2P6NQU1_9EUKA|nr:hypothetical protein PROFUN_05409 [Planoprotostelium fungivorum]